MLTEGINEEMLVDVKHIGKLSFFQEELVGQEHLRIPRHLACTITRWRGRSLAIVPSEGLVLWWVE